MTLIENHSTQPNEALRLPAAFRKAQDPISCYTHFIGAVCSLALLAVWTLIGLARRIPLSTGASLLVFALSLVALYSASSGYHSLPLADPRHTLFRKLDHSMIYVLIVGTYTPIVVTYSSQGWLAALVLWLIALAGVIIKVCWLNAPRWLYTGIYILLGWSLVFMRSVFANAPSLFLLWIFLGGVSYTVGGVFYILKRPNISRDWTFHETFHILIMAGSLCHIIGIWQFILK